MIFALIVFILTYVLMIALPKYRLITVIVSALIFLVFGVLPIKEVFNAIDWNVLMILLGTMGGCIFLHRIKNAKQNGGYAYFKIKKYNVGGCAYI